MVIGRFVATLAKTAFGFASLGLGMLYCVSVAYRNAYLRTLNVNPTLLGQTLQQTLYDGFVRSLSAIFFGLLAIAVGIMIYAMIERVIANYLVKREANTPAICPNPSFEAQIARGVAFGYVAIIFAAFIFYLSHVEKDAKRDAGALAGKIVDHTVESTLKVNINASGVEVAGIYLSCGTDRCAVLELKKKRILYVNPNQIEANFSP